MMLCSRAVDNGGLRPRVELLSAGRWGSGVRATQSGLSHCPTAVLTSCTWRCLVFLAHMTS